jgi:hypothetical protein
MASSSRLVHAGLLCASTPAHRRRDEALDQLMRWTERRDFLAPRVRQAKAPLWAILDLAEAHEQLGEERKAVSLLSTAELEYPLQQDRAFRLLHLYRSTGDMPKAAAEAKWFNSQPG